jgi:transposase
MRKMFQYRIFPTKKQQTRLNEALHECRWLYNHLLEKRKRAYEQEGKGLSCYDSLTYPQSGFQIDAQGKLFASGIGHIKIVLHRHLRGKVNPAYTSQTCSTCGHRQKMPLDVRVFDCPCCHVQLDRDLNAALNIRSLGLQALGLSVEAPAFIRGE